MKWLLLTFATTLTACSVSGGGSDSNGGNGGGPAGSKSVRCAQGLRICVDDMVVFYQQSQETIETGKILEIVPGGELSKQEKETVAQTRARDSRVADQMESLYRTNSKIWGLRLFSSVRPYNGFYSGDELKWLFVPTGCTATGKLCVGDKIMEWDDSSGLVEQSIIGISATPDAYYPLLTSMTFKSGKVTYYPQDSLGTPYVGTGCTSLVGSKAQVCVGERFWIYENNIFGNKLWENTVLYVPQGGKGPPVIKNQTGRIYQWSRREEESVYVERGCVAGMKDFCFPELSGKTVLYDYGGKASEANVLGIIIPEYVSRYDKPILVRSTEGKWYETIYETDAPTRLHRAPP